MSASPVPFGPRGEGGPPLKALAVDIQQNLEAPLREIGEIAENSGSPSRRSRSRCVPGTPRPRPGPRCCATRRTSSSPRPSPCTCWTAERSRETLRGIDTVIVDEIHALARDKRGSHLALSLERLADVTGGRPQRIGLSATQRPIETAARLLVGAAGPSAADARRVAIVDSGHRRGLELSLELPDGELEAVASAQQFAEILDRIAAHVAQHRTTLVFVNTRKLSERVAHELGERLGEDQVAAHHGALSARAPPARRAPAAGRRAASPRGHRLARARHRHRAGRARLPDRLAAQHRHLPAAGGPGQPPAHRSSRAASSTRPPATSWSSAPRCCAAVKRGRLDALHPAERPLDILAQQIVAEMRRGEDWAGEDELFELVRGLGPPPSSPARSSTRSSSWSRRGNPRPAAAGAWPTCTRDQVNGRLRGPPRGPAGRTDLRRRDPRDRRLPGADGAGRRVHRDRQRGLRDRVACRATCSCWAPRRGGSRRSSHGVVRVVDAHGAPPSDPVLAGRGARPHGRAVRGGLPAPRGGGRAAGRARRRRGRCQRVAPAAVRRRARRPPRRSSTTWPPGWPQLGVLPTHGHVVLERFFDESGGMQLVGHAPLRRAAEPGARARRCASASA